MTKTQMILATFISTLLLNGCGGGGGGGTATTTTITGATTTTDGSVTTTSQEAVTTTTSGSVTTTTVDPGPVALAVTSMYPDPDDGPVSASEIQTNGIYVIFNEAADGATVKNLRTTLTDDTSGGASVSGWPSYTVAERKGGFVPDEPLTAQYYYTATISVDLIDTDGVTQSTTYSWQFQVAE
ncbi:MAG: Ig-like domain-containing protein [Proteobacteria bacterium]|nr:Ig-like domain-containing protein [Pseudomonadota bacterium]MBU1687151.1 Ig-like domain-containing protein [Pseudomonadota bacterium]